MAVDRNLQPKVVVNPFRIHYWRVEFTKCWGLGLVQSSLHRVRLITMMFFALTVSANLQARQPNIVLILADDLGFETVGCMGGETYQTPNLDRLASQGLRLDRAYAMPLCTNSRIQLMTGKYNFRNWKAFGILDPNEPTFGKLFQQAGYKTCMAGKWQLTSYDPPDYPGAQLRRDTGTHPRDAGFDDYSLWHVGHTEDKGSRYADPLIIENGTTKPDTQGKYGPDLWTDFINRFISQNQKRPFFVYYSMALPHNPMVPTPDSPEWKDPANRHRDETQFAGDMIEYTDKMVGKVVDHIDSLGLDRETLIVFYSDNGTNYRVMSRYRGKMLRGGKGKGTELGIRVPAMVRWTGTIEPGRVSEDLFDTVDVMPTLLDAAGAKQLTPANLDGFSFLDHFKQDIPGPRKHVLIHQDPRPGWDKDRFDLIRLALDSQFKLYEDGRLFDLVNDPYEDKARLIAEDDARHAAHRRQLQQVLDTHSDYRRFDPTTVPRPSANESTHGARFQDQGGCVVVEAELLPVPRDESWLAESKINGALGLGYLRSLCQQESFHDEGVTPIEIILDNAGEWKVAVRCRFDHAQGQQRSFSFRKAGQPWTNVELASSLQAGSWHWIDPFSGRLAEAGSGVEVQLKERGNEFEIAPVSSNFKVDRIVIYQEDRAQYALDPRSPPSALHRWASP